MRHLLFALMIALLPLRGWVGDAMAAQMASTALAHTGAAAHHTMHDAPADPALALHDCAGHDDRHEQAGTTQGDCSTCTACQICHSVALTPPLPHRTPASLTSGQPQASHPHFASAERAPGFKPPIP
jgi:hypothetical protein